MSAPVKLAIRFAIYLAVLAYLVCDLFVWKGPLHETVAGTNLDSEEAIAEAKAMGIAARVYHQPIYRAQVETRVAEYLWKRGRVLEEASLSERRFLREMAIEQLIDELLIKIQIKLSAEGSFEVSEEEQRRFFEQFKQRYPSGEEFTSLMESQGWNGGVKEAGMRLNGRLQREVYLADFIKIEITDEELQAWFDDNRAKYLAPERRQVRQVFLSTYDYEPEQAEAIIRAARKRVVEGKEDFMKVAGEIAEALKLVGPSWVTQERLPKDVALRLFSASTNKPFVFQSKLGWHLAEITAIEVEAEAPFEEVKEAIRQAITTERKEAGFAYFHRLMRLRAEGKIEIFEDVLYAEELE
ncbi:MAG: peptidyl-prolyl cis-trans isomerase [Akkermansiaceae bacterium]